MTGQSKEDQTDGTKDQGLQRWCEDIVNFGRGTKECFRKIPWFAYVILVIGKVAKANKAISLHLERSPVFMAFSSTLHVVACVTYVVFVFGVLAHQLAGTAGSSRVAKTRVLVENAFSYLEKRLKSMDTWVQQLDDMGLCLGNLAIDNDFSGMIVQLWKFKFAVRQCRLDIDECLEKLGKTIPEVEMCIAELESAKQWTSTINGIFGVAAAGGLAIPGVGWIIAGVCSAQFIFQNSTADASNSHLNHFLEFLARSQSISSDLARVKLRLDSHEEAARWLLQQERKLAALVEAEDTSRCSSCNLLDSCASCVFTQNPCNSYVSEIILIICSLMFFLVFFFGLRRLLLRLNQTD